MCFYWFPVEIGFFPVFNPCLTMSGISMISCFFKCNISVKYSLPFLYENFGMDSSAKLKSTLHNMWICWVCLNCFSTSNLPNFKVTLSVCRHPCPRKAKYEMSSFLCCCPRITIIITCLSLTAWVTSFPSEELSVLVTCILTAGITRCN